MRLFAVLLLMVYLARVSAEDDDGWESFTLTFVDKGSVLQTTQVSPDGNEWAEVEEGAIELSSPTPGGPFDGLKAKCVAMSGPGESDRSKTEGWCTFQDGDGDMVFEHYTGALDNQGGGGRAFFTGGTGKFQGVEAEHSWRYTFTAQGDDWYEGRGHKEGRFRYRGAGSEV
eukprot:Hpha_TRINITY_DN19358_c0_g1::TRINITY_DN19358_c0_g1_i1::g.81132::m.81132